MRDREMRIAAGLLAAVLLAAAPAPAQEAARLFEPQAFVLELDGRAVGDAEVFQSRAAGALLVLSAQLPVPVLVRLREGQVETVAASDVGRNGDGTVALLASGPGQPRGSYRQTDDGEGIAFEIDGRRAVVREKPPLLGAQDLGGMEDYSPEYVRTAAAYSPSGPILERLRSQGQDVRVVVYFGTWCPFCQQMVPRMMRVAQELAGSKVQFDFYGLPRGISSDPEARRAGISGVPTGVVYVGRREVGRISGNSWKIPELAINRVLTGPAS